MFLRHQIYSILYTPEKIAVDSRECLIILLHNFFYWIRYLPYDILNKRVHVILVHFIIFSSTTK